MLRSAHRLILSVALAALVGCADDKRERASADADRDTDTAAGTGPTDAAVELGDVRGEGDGTPSLARDAATGDGGVTQTEPPLTIPSCNDVSEEPCCRSAIGFEDGSTNHFLPATCCKLALTNPVRVTAPTACGRGALQLDADFRATSEASLCDTPAQAPMCSYRTGEISRAVLTALDLTGQTISVALFLEGGALPASPHQVHGQIFLLTKAGLMEGPLQLIAATDRWTAIEFPVLDDGTAPGAEVRLLGVRLAFGGQPWAGRVYVDEMSWRETQTRD